MFGINLAVDRQSLSHLRVSEPDQDGRRYYAYDYEQPGPPCRPVSRRIGYIRRQWPSFLQLGSSKISIPSNKKEKKKMENILNFPRVFLYDFPVPAGDALSGWNDGWADAGHVFRTSARSIPFHPLRPTRRHHQRNGHPELFESRALRQNVCPRSHNVNTKKFFWEIFI